MSVRKIAYRLAIVAALIVLFTLITIPANDTANACLPCDCPENTTINCFGHFGIFILEGGRNNQCAIQILGTGPNGGEYEAIYLDSEAMSKLPERPEENLLIDSYYEYAMYKLTSGEYQVNVGPDAEGKVYVVNFRGCPATDVRESNFIAAANP